VLLVLQLRFFFESLIFLGRLWWSGGVLGEVEVTWLNSQLHACKITQKMGGTDCHQELQRGMDLQCVAPSPGHQSGCEVITREIAADTSDGTDW